MGRPITIESLRPLLRIESAIVAVVLVVAALWYFQDQSISEAKLEQSGLEQRLRTVRIALSSSIANDDSNALEEQLSELQSAGRGLLALPSQETAKEFGDQLLLYADEQELEVLAFGKTDTASIVGEKEYQAIRFAIRTQGTSDSLVGVLNLLTQFPTTAVQLLNFAKIAQGQEIWELALELDLFYGDGEF